MCCTFIFAKHISDVDQLGQAGCEVAQASVWNKGRSVSRSFPCWLTLLAHTDKNMKSESPPSLPLLRYAISKSLVVRLPCFAVRVGAGDDDDDDGGDGDGLLHPFLVAYSCHKFEQEG